MIVSHNKPEDVSFVPDFFHRSDTDVNIVTFKYQKKRIDIATKCEINDETYET